MSASSWRERAATVFRCEKQPAMGSKGMVVSNHPLASAAGAEMLAAGGNAIDAAIATLFALTAAEPMMVGIVGGGTGHIRLANGEHTVIDGMATAPLKGSPTMYRPVPGAAKDVFDTVDQENAVGPKAVAAPGNLRAWCQTLARFGTFSLDDVIQPAIRIASRGFRVSPYLHHCISEAAPDLKRSPAACAVLLPNGEPLRPGERLVNGDYGETLRYIAKEADAALHGGPIGDAVADYIQANGGCVSREDLVNYQPIDRAPIRGSYRGYEIVAPPPPAASGVHITQMLNILEGYDIAALGFGSVENLHLLAEVLKIAFADREAASGDPAFIDVPVAKLTSKEYAAERRALIDLTRAQSWSAGISPSTSAYTTHMTAADSHGNVVATTQTINSLFGARFIVPGTGLIPNNYMNTYDPRPGNALSIIPGKRVTTSMAPTMVLRDGKIRFALGLPGGKRIFPSVMQALLNLLDHNMSLQEAVEAPRVWTEGNNLEMEGAFPETTLRALRKMGHTTQTLPTVAGGMNAIEFLPNNTLRGAACWRADGTAIGVGGGLAREGVRFWPDAPVLR
jgi:gamma-glutamyltranspeptidase/glutathione hydrolase